MRLLSSSEDSVMDFLGKRCSVDGRPLNGKVFNPERAEMMLGIPYCKALTTLNQYDFLVSWYQISYLVKKLSEINPFKKRPFGMLWLTSLQVGSLWKLIWFPVGMFSGIPNEILDRKKYDEPEK